MSPGDKALESIIAQLTSAIAMTGDPRLAKLQQQAILMRSAAQVAHMEKQRGIVTRHWPIGSRPHG